MPKETKKQIKKILLISLASIIAVTLPLSFLLSRGQARYAVLPYKTLVRIDRNGELSSFLKQEEITDKLPFALIDSLPEPVKVGELEESIEEQITYIKSAKVYISPSTRTLNIEVEERTPILRYYKSGDPYFLDEEGISIPWRSGAAADVPIATGAVNDSTLHTTLYPLAQYLSKSKDYRTFFPLIDVRTDRQVQLYPRIGDYIFELHGIESLEEDLAKVPIFYRRIIPKVGTNKYRLIKLSYKDQIICTLKDPKSL